MPRWVRVMAAGAALLASACGAGGPGTTRQQSPPASPGPAFAVPMQPFVEDCTGATCTVLSSAPFSFRVTGTDRPRLPPRLPVARYPRLTADTAEGYATALLGPGWQVRSAPASSPSYVTPIEIDLARGEERLAVRGRTMTAAYSAAALACQPAKPDPAIAASRAWLAAHRFALAGLSPSSVPAPAGPDGRPCGVRVPWAAPAYSAGSLRHATVDVAGSLVAAAELSLPPEATRELAYEPLTRALAIAAALGSGPPADARAGLTYACELGYDGAWYLVPAATITAVSPGGSADRVVLALAPLG